MPAHQTGAYRATMDGMIGTDFFQCDRCHIECRIDFRALEPNTLPLIIQHCPDSKGIPIFGKVTKFQERRGGLWVDVQMWIDAAQRAPFSLA